MTTDHQVRRVTMILTQFSPALTAAGEQSSWQGFQPDNQGAPIRKSMLNPTKHNAIQCTVSRVNSPHGFELYRRRLASSLPQRDYHGRVALCRKQSECECYAGGAA